MTNKSKKFRGIPPKDRPKTKVKNSFFLIRIWHWLWYWIFDPRGLTDTETMYKSKDKVENTLVDATLKLQDKAKELKGQKGLFWRGLDKLRGKKSNDK